VNNSVLYIVSTPIGNLKDITLRAIEVLKSSDIILCEDKRKTSILLSEYNIKTKLLNYTDYNKLNVTPKILNLLHQNKKISLVSDAGTPTVSDPGYYLINQCISNNYQIIPIPGVSALITALTVSGLPSNNFIFLGFLPNNKNKQLKILNNFKQIKSSIIIYESPKRIYELLENIQKIFNNIELAICRELTKKFEQIIHGNITKILEKKQIFKGEIVVIINNSNIEEIIDEKIFLLYNELQETNLEKNIILKIISKTFNIKKNVLYSLIKNYES
jgi:16S rRNA (cytidine1402-2'-O)-methyltransferase